MRVLWTVGAVGLGGALAGYWATGCTSATGPRGSGTAAGGHDASAPRCQNSLDCAGRTDGKTVCSAPSGECVQCLHASDCGADAALRDCVANTCITYQACVNSLDCSAGWVCDRTTNRCVQCTVDADCVTDGGLWRCAGNVCRTACTSDNNCTPLGLLCNTAEGYCAACVRNEDCPTNRWCSQGACALDVCTAGATRCEAGGLSTCDSAGSAWGSPVACGTNQSCGEYGGVASCETRICTPSAVTCAGGAEQVLTCSADGLTNTVTADCGASGQVCVGGACMPIVCTAGARFCENNTVRSCSAKGDSSTLYATCSATQYCYAASPSCQARICTANAAACNGSVATTCNADGSGYLDGGTDCAATSQVCSAGTCQTPICTASALFGEAGVVRRCSADGLTSTVNTTCTSSQYCDAATTSCKARICTANAAACNATVATTCNADGSGYLDGGTDCAATSQLCYAGSCVSQVTETIGTATYSSASTYNPRLNLYLMTDDRTLQVIEQYLSVSAATALVWLVYEATSQTGTYTQIWSSTTTVSTATLGYQSSGTLATPVPLVSGRYYAIGVAWGSVALTYYYQSATLPVAASFGSLFSGFYMTTLSGTSFTFSTTSSTIYPQRLTTGPAA